MTGTKIAPHRDYPHGGKRELLLLQGILPQLPMKTGGFILLLYQRLYPLKAGLQALLRPPLVSSK
jgi:hypothetical protein